ncbi:DUF2249 domain-containing protein [Elizabethkingia sp. JS20170427COW]|uniref:DUF2249 domain-containing protein n=1 Tax=Elizabethkingia sp. JS20170427COW TaxID=2583851 RepID=UPI001110AA2F|nr:DUF2249 domain-containing protein [Elizabethkingia sp. JS20170427COW]QCX52304.1 DUF2249 domain-containing protein [Elizabethkingia sp. JS20170427COW]
MLINEQTKIAALLKHHPDALETIVAIAPDFKKLRNPILRKLMAGRTSIAMASKIGGVKPEDFFTALAPLGFETEGKIVEETSLPISQPKPEYLQNLPKEKLVDFDVRAMLASGNDPLREIQQKVKALQTGEVLLIVNNFEPVPLIKLLEKQGFQTYVNFVNRETIETYFYKIPNQDIGDTHQENVFPAEPETEETGDWDLLLQEFQGKLLEIDVRHLEMPMPMMTILESLETLPEDQALFVNHKKVPVFLLTELKDRNFDYRIKEVTEGEVYLLIFKNRD